MHIIIVRTIHTLTFPWECWNSSWLRRGVVTKRHTPENPSLHLSQRISMWHKLFILIEGVNIKFSNKIQKAFSTSGFSLDFIRRIRFLGDVCRKTNIWELSGCGDVGRNHPWFSRVSSWSSTTPTAVYFYFLARGLEASQTVVGTKVSGIISMFSIHCATEIIENNLVYVANTTSFCTA